MGVCLCVTCIYEPFELETLIFAQTQFIYELIQGSQGQSQTYIWKFSNIKVKIRQLYEDEYVFSEKFKHFVYIIFGIFLMKSEWIAYYKASPKT